MDTPDSAKPDEHALAELSRQLLEEILRRRDPEAFVAALVRGLCGQLQHESQGTGTTWTDHDTDPRLWRPFCSAPRIGERAAGTDSSSLSASNRSPLVKPSVNRARIAPNSPCAASSSGRACAREIAIRRAAIARMRRKEERWHKQQKLWRET